MINRTTQHNVAGTSLLEIGGSQSANGLVRIVNAVNQADVNHGSLMIINTTNYAIGNDASIGFGLQNAANSFTDPRASIGCKTESSYGGALVFNTRVDSGTYTEKMRITGNGILNQNGLGRVGFRGNIAGNQSVTVTVNCVSESSFKITCMMNHYGLFNSYGCAKMSFYANGPSSDESVISNVTSGNGGSWSISRVSNTSFSITKNAGSYAGPGEYFIEVIGATLT